jgi:predicted SAM-dependent methyltransferase
MMKILTRLSSKATTIFQKLQRVSFSQKYIRGNGIEIGALHNSLKVSRHARVKYVDRMDCNHLREHYPELQKFNLVPVDIIDDGEALTTIPNNSLDFIIANHFLEHCKNPIAVLKNFYAKLSLNGIMYMAIPDKRYTFDRTRDLTSFEHVANDYNNITDHFPHFVDFARHVGKINDEVKILADAKKMSGMDYSIHYHVWNATTFRHFLSASIDLLNLNLRVLEFKQNFSEIIAILRKM